MKRLANQLIKFIGISGVGWIIDFSVYFLLSTILNWPVFFANCISAIPAVSLVFIVSTKKIFQKSKGVFSIHMKYLIYLGYQTILLLLVSLLGQWMVGKLSEWVIEFHFVKNITKLLVKICITPITMLANFIVMKLLTERI